MNGPRYLSALARRSSEPAISWLMRLGLERPAHVNLAAGFTDNLTLPLAAVRALSRELLADNGAGRAALQYGTTIGAPALRGQLAARLSRQESLPIEPERLVITNGSQQLLWLVSQVLCDPGDIIGVEDPTYFVYLGITEALGARTFGFSSVADLERRLARLERAGQLGRLKLLYLVTYYQNPTGRTWTAAQKAELHALVKRYEPAAGHPIFILEDAGYRDLRIDGTDERSFLGLDPRQRRVIYSSTLSKPFATGLRLGYAVLPPALAGPVLRSKGNQDFGSANYLQALLGRALASGVYDRHLTVLAAAYGRKRDAMVAALRRHLPQARFESPQGGLFVWAELPGAVRTGFRSRLFRRALDTGVLYVPGELCFCRDNARPVPRNGMRLSFGSAGVGQLEAGIERLRNALG